jgi:inorganic pyrophosphatase
MADNFMDPIGRLMGLRFKSHPWHGVEIGSKAPEVVTCYIEMVPTDTVKYEVDKKSGYLMIDRPQKYSNIVPALYGFIPQTYSGDRVAAYSMEKSGKSGLTGDSDPMDILVLTEKEITHGDILVFGRPIGGLRMIDGMEADDKIIAILDNDAVYGRFRNIFDLPTPIIDRLKHYFLTYKDLPGNKREREITDVYGIEEAHEVIRYSMEDYQNKFSQMV